MLPSAGVKAGNASLKNAYITKKDGKIRPFFVFIPTFY